MFSLTKFSGMTIAFATGLTFFLTGWDSSAQPLAKKKGPAPIMQNKQMNQKKPGLPFAANQKGPVVQNQKKLAAIPNGNQGVQNGRILAGGQVPMNGRFQNAGGQNGGGQNGGGQNGGGQNGDGQNGGGGQNGQNGDQGGQNGQNGQNGDQGGQNGQNGQNDN